MCNLNVTAWLGLFTLMQSFEGQLTHFCWIFFPDFFICTKIVQFFSSIWCYCIWVQPSVCAEFSTQSVWCVFAAVNECVCLSVSKCKWVSNCVFVCMCVCVCVYVRERESVCVFADVSGYFRTRSYLVLFYRLSLNICLEYKKIPVYVKKSYRTKIPMKLTILFLAEFLETDSVFNMNRPTNWH